MMAQRPLLIAVAGPYSNRERDLVVSKGLPIYAAVEEIPAFGT